MMSAPPCKQAHGLTPHGWVHTKDGKPCKHMNDAHAALQTRTATDWTKVREKMAEATAKKNATPVPRTPQKPRS